MRRASMLVAMLLLAGSSLKSGGQSWPAASADQETVTPKEQKAANLPLARTFRPKLPMQDALKIAENYIDKQHIDISSYWLSQVRYILYGSENAADKDKIPCWYFWWMSDTGAAGDYVEIFVDMKGRAWRVPSM
ncbi:MAG TPA: hypothetical protein VKE93_12545 [Candidatus Angelobacter sp.]|nr:hypothetical protein [Candidatus Angelobacter sp.]